MKTISILNLKGGVGKTTSAIHLGEEYINLADQPDLKIEKLL